MLKVSDIHLNFGDAQILNGLSFSLNAGERVGIIGPNGSGKTTLFNCLSGFNKPSKGSIHFFDESLGSVSPSERARRGLGRLFQNFGIFRNMTVEENLLVALESRARLRLFNSVFSKRKFNDQIDEYLSRVGLLQKRKDKAGSLSGGQLRLLEIIRLIAFGAKLFLLDEPTAGVSPKMKIEILNAMKDLLDKNVMVLLIEHDIRFIQEYCERVLVLDGGRVVLDGTPDEVRNDPRLQEIYFGTSAVNSEKSEPTKNTTFL
ncbi:MAG TPA: ABC transporter ATP-binding protein [Oligoflexia bacterium]|nr:ABC transporter ATP-binding protein [Oligoflexia bacterium]HMP48442.1 ABC transporter ATP-binding protein [Oligoflexia bacterium]